MSRFTGLQFTGLPCLPVFFFRATPSLRFTGGMPVYRGGSFFHARGAPPAAAHSHTRCCTQHNTTRWVLRAAANICLHTMPCAAGELCQLSDSTTTPEFSCCGPCGCRLHGIYGDPDDDEEVYAESCGISGAAYHLRKAKMDLIHARSSKPAVQADIRAMFSNS